MKNIFRAGLIIIFLLVDNCFSQSYQIAFSYAESPDYFVETDEYLFVTCRNNYDPAISSNDITIIRFDKRGNNLIRKTVSGNLGNYKFIEANDNQPLLVITQDSLPLSQIKLIRFNKDLNTLWEIIIEIPGEIFSTIYQDSDNSFLLITKLLDNSAFVRILNNNGELQSGQSLYEKNIKKIYRTGSNFYAQSDYDLVKFSETLQFITSTNFIYPIQDLVSFDDCNLVYHSPFGKDIYKIDFEGNIVKKISLTLSIRSLSTSADKHLIISLRNDSVVKIDTAGTLIFSISSLANSYHIKSAYPLQDNSLLLLIEASYGKNFLTRCTSTGDYKFLAVPRSLSGSGFDYKKNLFWYSMNVGEIDIFYCDFNNNRIPLVKNHSPASNSYSFDVPKNLKKIIIMDSNNPGIGDSIDFNSLKLNYPHYDFLSINNFKMWISNDGRSESPDYGWAGALWKNLYDSVKSVLFRDGLLWGGLVQGNTHINGSSYTTGIAPGNIINNQPADPYTKNYAPFKIKKNFQFLPNGIEKDNYKYCFENWPVNLGAEWIDRNSDGFYSSGIDEPKFSGDEVLFYVANDLYQRRSFFVYGCEPIGIEVQTTVFGYDSTNFLNDVVFKKYLLINKSGKEIDEMYFSYFADGEVGSADDDFTGCDSALNLAYVWNSDNYDYYFGSNPPAIGHMILQGPIVSSDASDRAKFNGQWRYGFKNLPASSYVPDWNIDFDFRNQDESVFYNYIVKGLDYNSRIPLDFINLNTGVKTLFPLNGDPETEIGWYEGIGWPGGPYRGDRRYWLNTGPFNMAPADTQEIVIGILAAQGSSNLNSVTKLKTTAGLAQHFYNEFKLDFPDERPADFILFQNFPNPFNNSTTIRYSLKDKAFVRIKLYDILGREITTLVDEEKVPWSYEVRVDGLNLASGVYIYRIEAGGFIQSKKMIFLK